MNINIQSNYDSAEANNIRLLADKLKNREVNSIKAGSNQSVSDEILVHEKKEYQEKIQQAVTMDANEVKDFLFMLIGAEVKIKSDNDNSGSLINRLA